MQPASGAIVGANTDFAHDVELCGQTADEKRKTCQREKTFDTSADGSARRIASSHLIAREARCR